MQILFKEIVSLLYWFAIIFIAPKIFRNNEYARKFVHLMIANWWFIAIYFFDTFLSACIVPVLFLIINTYSTLCNKKSLVGSLKRNSDDFSLGLICYPLGYIVSIYLGYYFMDYPYIAGIGIMSLGYGDAFAAIIGQKYCFMPYSVFGNRKTVSGSLGMCFFSFIAIYSYCLLFNISSAFQISLLCTLIGSIIEAVSINGIDNFLIPVCINIILCVM